MKLISKLKKIIRRNRIITYCLVFIFLLILSAVISVKSILLPLDLYVYKILHFNSNYVEGFEDKIIFINILDESNGAKLSKEELKYKSAELLKMIDSMVIEQKGEYKKMEENYKSPYIVLDASFDNNPAGHEELMEVIDALYYEREVKVYGVYDMPDNNSQYSFDVHDKGQAQKLYRNYFEGGRLHTDIVELKNCVLSYKSYLTIENENKSPVIIESLALVVANDYRNEEGFDKPHEPVNYTLPFRPLESLTNHTYNFGIEKTNSVDKIEYSSFKKSLDIHNKIIIIGFFDRDETQKICKLYEISGSHLVGWAIWDQLNGNKLARQPFDNQLIQWSIILFCALMVTVVFVLLFKFQKKLQTRPWLISVISFLSGVTILFCIGYLIFSLNSGGEIIRPSLPVLGMLWSSILASHYHQILIDLGIVEGGEKYDIFISYSGAQRAWVRKYVYAPLKSLKKIDNTNIKIFFDQEEIDEGAAFVHTYKTAITNSKIFVPIMTEDYFDSPYCRKEMSFADGRAETDLIRIYPIAFDDTNAIPSIYQDKNITIIKENVETDFIGKLKKRLDKLSVKNHDD